MANKFGDRIASEAKAAMPIKNENLVCKDCIYKFDDKEIAGNTSKCKMFNEVKPTAVLNGKECALYENSRGGRI